MTAPPVHSFFFVWSWQTHIKQVATLNDTQMYNWYKNDPANAPHAHLVSKRDFIALKPFWIALPMLLWVCGTIRKFGFLQICIFFPPPAFFKPHFCDMHCRFCVCYIHLEFQKMLQVLQQYYSAVHDQPCDCTCQYCENGNCDPDNNTKIFELHNFMRHLLCQPEAVFESEGGKYHYYRWECVTLQCNLCYKSKAKNLLLCPKAKLWADHLDADSGLTWEEYKRTDINIVNTSNYQGPNLKLACAPKKKKFFNLFQVM